ncbi:AP-1 complex subunit mu-1-like protein [Ascosphaera atra]|nr:AP-1 complex subunit mu-1-like protein [Ascosphaera atra]
MASAVFFLDLKGKTLLCRNYRGDIPMSAVEKFPMLLSEAEEESSAVPPCFSSEGINYLYIRHSNLYLLALTKRNTNATEILLFLHKIVEVFTEYFKELEEESIRDNYVIIYELLDEMMDFGYPQTTESKILQECASPSFAFQASINCTYSTLTVDTPDTSPKNRTSSKSKPGHQLP